MIELNEPVAQKRPTTRLRVSSFCVHILTASGAAAGLIATLEAVRHHWAAMFVWLGVALIIDAIDGPLARRLNVADVLPNWSGDMLDFVVDFVTYVFVPAFVIAESSLVWKPLAVPLAAAVVVSGALYFSDLRMKTADNYFRGFPVLWNVAVFYLFVVQAPPLFASLIVATLITLTFVPIRVLHPVRVARLRRTNLALTCAWGLLALWAIGTDFALPTGAIVAFCAIGVYFVFGDSVWRVLSNLRTR